MHAINHVRQTSHIYVLRICLVINRRCVTWLLCNGLNSYKHGILFIPLWAPCRSSLQFSCRVLWRLWTQRWFLWGCRVPAGSERPVSACTAAAAGETPHPAWRRRSMKCPCQLPRRQGALDVSGQILLTYLALIQPISSSMKISLPSSLSSVYIERFRSKRLDSSFTKHFNTTM